MNRFQQTNFGSFLPRGATAARVAHPMVNRVRIRFSKEQDLRLISHRDLVRALERLFRRANISVCQSEGFHPKPRMNFAAPLGLGIAGRDEVMEVDLADTMTPHELLSTLNEHTVLGLRFSSVEPLVQYAKKAQAKALCYEAQIPAERAEQVEKSVADFLAASSWVVMRDNRPVDIRPLVEKLALENEMLTMRLGVIHEAGARPRDVLEALGFSADEIPSIPLERTLVEVHP